MTFWARDSIKTCLSHESTNLAEHTVVSCNLHGSGAWTVQCVHLFIHLCSATLCCVFSVNCGSQLVHLFSLALHYPMFLPLQTTKAHSWTCIDLYVFATPYRVTWDYYFLGREHTLDFKEWESEAEYEYVSVQLCFN